MLLYFLAFLFLLFATSLQYCIFKKRCVMRLMMKEKFFQQNGGHLLQQRLAASKWLAESFRIFTEEELELATANYSESRILGHGCGSTVYKGFISCTGSTADRVVAIKKWCCGLRQACVEQFINELLVLSQLIHENVVRILGCCLEAQVPLVVYDYIPNGTLHHHIHGCPGSLSWEARLRIAVAAAEALVSLHAAIPEPLFHRGFKTANILLDDNLTAKISDFGGRLLQVDCLTFSRLLSGREGYLDPEFFRNMKSVEKSDVYSFGVMVAELLTGQQPVSAAKIIGEGRLGEALEGRVREEGSTEVVAAVAEVARRCLVAQGEDRPPMREVAAELRAVLVAEDYVGGSEGAWK